MKTHIGEGIVWVINRPDGTNEAIDPTLEIARSRVPYVRNNWPIKGDHQGMIRGLGHLIISQEVVDAMELYCKRGGYSGLRLHEFLDKMVSARR